MPEPCSQLAPDCDLFCKVVDNFGDIGVCWRLARDLAANHGMQVRLWVDDWAAFARLCPAAAAAPDRFVAGGVEVRRWRMPMPPVRPAGLVVEAFACELPDGFVAAMPARRPHPVWVNLEYLSAEEWVGGCHGLASPHPRLPLVKHFFFPGFGPDTGGLPREPELLAGRDRFRQTPGLSAEWAARIGIPPPPADARLVSLFSYEQAALPALLQTLAAGQPPTWLLVPQGRVTPQVAEFLAEAEVSPGARFTRGALTIFTLPFLSQDDYDRLLWTCDLNFVRGEDSFVRAQWAARPFVWHIYEQEAHAHRPKLESFLNRFLAGADAALAAAVRDLWRAWNGDGDAASAWQAFAAVLPEFGVHTRRWSEALAAQPDLATSLVQFLEGKVK